MFCSPSLWKQPPYAGAAKPSMDTVTKSRGGTRQNATISVDVNGRPAAPRGGLGRVRTGEHLHISLGGDEDSQESFVVVAAAVAAIVGILFG